MPTIEGVIRRGIVPQSIRQFTLQVGYTKSEHTFDWSLLLSANRKILDPTTKRYYFVPDPVRLTVANAPDKAATMLYHPLGNLGERTIRTSGEFFVPSADIGAIEMGRVFRLMELYNIRFDSRSPDGSAAGTYLGEELLENTRKLQWVTPDGSQGIEVMEPSELFKENGTFNTDSLKIRLGLVEDSFSSVKRGEIVQFPRYGFVRLDAPSRCVLAHG